MTRDAVIQVKSGTGRGALTQALNTTAVTSEQVIVYGPDLGWQQVRNLTNNGIWVAQNPEDLLTMLGH